MAHILFPTLHSRSSLVKLFITKYRLGAGPRIGAGDAVPPVPGVEDGLGVSGLVDFGSLSSVVASDGSEIDGLGRNSGSTV